MPSVTLTPTTIGPFYPGDTVSFELTTSNDFPSFIGFQSSLSYNADELSFEGTTFNDEFLVGNDPFVRDRVEPEDAAGEITLEPIIAGRFNGAFDGEVTVATYNFTVLRAGNADVQVEGFRGFFTNADGVTVFDDGVATSIQIDTRPFAVDDSSSVLEDGSIVIDVLGNDEDFDDGGLTIQSFSQGTNGTVELSGTGLLYRPAADFAGTDTFTYDVFDGEGTDTATVTITVTGENDLPVVTVVTASTDEDTAVSVDVLAGASDVDGDTLTIKSVGAATNGTVEISGGSILFTPDANFNGDGSFLYEIDDGNGGSVSKTVTVAVAPVNDLPIGSDDFAEVTEGQSVDIDVLANDSDVDVGDTLSILSFGPAANGSVVRSTDGKLTYTPNAGFAGDDSFDYTVSDSNGGEATATASVTVFAANKAPVAVADIALVDEDDNTLISVLANDTDEDDDALTITGHGNASNGTVSQEGSGLRYTPNVDFNGEDSFTYTISDGKGGTSQASVTVTVAAVNDAPVLAVGDTFEFVEGATGPIFTPTATDIDDGDVLTFSLSGVGADDFTIDTQTGTVSIDSTPDIAPFGTEDFDLRVSVSDGTVTVGQDVRVTILSDSDGDGIADQSDNATFVSNPDQRDSNGDGYGNVIDGDFDGDGFVGVADLAFMRGAFGRTRLTDGDDPAADADFDGDGSVLSEDLRSFAELYGLDLGSSAQDFEIA